MAIAVKIGEEMVTMGGMCKGSGMIHPNMATMLGVITCDAWVDPQIWQKVSLRASGLADDGKRGRESGHKGRGRLESCRHGCPPS